MRRTALTLCLGFFLSLTAGAALATTLEVPRRICVVAADPAPTLSVYQRVTALRKEIWTAYGMYSRSAPPQIEAVADLGDRLEVTLVATQCFGPRHGEVVATKVVTICRVAGEDRVTGIHDVIAWSALEALHQPVKCRLCETSTRHRHRGFAIGR